MHAVAADRQAVARAPRAARHRHRAYRPPRAHGAAAALSLGFILLPLVLVIWLAFFRQEIPSFPPRGLLAALVRRASSTNKSFVGGFLPSLQVGDRRDPDRACARGAGEPRDRAPALPRPRRRQHAAADAAGRAGRRARHRRSTCSRSRPRSRPGCRCSARTAGAVAAHALIVDPVGGAARDREPCGLRSGRSRRRRRTSAPRPWTTFRRVTLPAIRPGIVAGGAVRLRHVVRQSRNEPVPGRRRAAPRCRSRSCSISNGRSIRRSPPSRCMQIALIGAAMLVTDRYVKIAQVV